VATRHFPRQDISFKGKRLFREATTAIDIFIDENEEEQSLNYFSDRDLI